jgi:hypothetical protein
VLKLGEQLTKRSRCLNMVIAARAHENEVRKVGGPASRKRDLVAPFQLQMRDPFVLGMVPTVAIITVR